MKTLINMFCPVVLLAVVMALATPASAVLPGKSTKPEPYAMGSDADSRMGPAGASMSLQELERRLLEISQEMADVEMAWMEEARDASNVRMAMEVKGLHDMGDLEAAWMRADNWPALKSKVAPIVRLSPIPVLKTPWDQRMDIAPTGVLRAIEWGSRSLASMEADWMTHYHERGPDDLSRVLVGKSEAMANLEAEWMR